LIVNVLGLRGFLPSSQVARAYAGSLESLVGQRIPVKILEVNRKRNRLIVSQKAAEDEDRHASARALQPAADGHQRSRAL